MAKKRDMLKDIVPESTRPLSEFQRRIEIEQKLDKSMPEQPIEFPETEEPIENVKVTYEKGEKRFETGQPTAVLKSYPKLKKNPLLIPLVNLEDHARIYFDINESEDFLYKFHPTKPYSLSKLKLTKFNVETLLAYCLERIYGERLVSQKDRTKRVGINKRLKKKLKAIHARNDLLYEYRI